MAQNTLVSETTDAGANLVREFDKYQPVRVAFWLKASDEEQHYLYIASEEIDDTNFDLAYGEAFRLAQRVGSPYLDPFRVKLINADDALAHAAVQIRDRFPGPIATRLGGSSFGGMMVDEVYIYPASVSAVRP